MLDGVFEYFGEDQIKRFEGIWSNKEPYTRNYNEFMKHIEDGKSAVEAAWGTWTGQQLKARGFKRVEIDEVTPDARPDGVTPRFYKDGEPNVP